MVIAEDKDILISVIVPSYNGEHTISQCLTALMGQDFDKGSYEVIVVDSSDDKTPEIVREKFPDVKLIHLPQKTRTAQANNIGIQHARGKYIAIIHADCIAESDTLNRYLKHHQEGKYDGVGGAIVNGTPYSPMGWIYYLTEFNGYTPWDPKRLLTHIAGIGCYKKETLAKYGLCHSGNFTAEDLVMNWEITKKGGKLLFDPEIRVAHINPTKFSSYVKAQLRLGRSSAMARRRIKDLKGQAFVKYPVFALGLPFIRFALLVSRLLRTNLKALIILLILSPIYFIGLLTWTIGFFKGVMAEEKDVWGTDCGRK